MIPVSLTIQGLYSYQTRQTIDFTKLTSAGIFGIFGAVGSGKSTIIEAITYALFGRTDRLNLSGDNRNYNMMNLKSNDLFIEFIFKAGTPTREFMALVKSKRNSRQFDDVKTLDRSAYLKVEGDWKPVTVESLENTIGLSYENFKRTVIIPQGKFQEFLLLGNKERTQMMKELFNLEKFELYYKVVSLENKSLEQKQLIEGKLQQIGEIAPENIKNKEIEIQQMGNHLKMLTNNLEISMKEEAGLTLLKELIHKIQEHENILTNLKLQESDIFSLEQKVRLYEYCRIHFYALLESKTSCENRSRMLIGEMEVERKMLQESKTKLAQLEGEMKSTGKEYEERELLKAQSEDLSMMARIRELNVQAEILQQRIPNGEKHLADNQQLLERIHEEQEQNVQSLKALKSAIPDLRFLAEIKQWFTIQKMNDQNEQEILQEEKSLEDNQRQLVVEVQQKLREVFPEVIYHPGREDEIHALLVMNQKNILAKKEELNQELNHYQVQMRLHDFTTALQKGLPCPLCGATEHPQVLVLEDVREHMTRILQQIEFQDHKVLELEVLQKDLTGFFSSLKHHAEMLGKIQARKKEVVQKRLHHQQQKPAMDYTRVEEVSKAFEEAEIKQRQIKVLEDQVEKNRVLIEKEINNKDAFYKGLEKLKSDLQIFLVEAATLSRQLKILKVEDYRNEKSEKLKENSILYLRKYEEISIRYEALKENILQITRQADALESRLHVKQDLLDKESTTLQEILRKLEEKLAESNQSLIEVQNLLEWNPDLESLHLKISKYRNDVEYHHKLLNQLQTERGDRTYQPEVHQQRIILINQMKNELDSFNRNLGKLEEELKLQKRNLEERNKLLSVMEWQDARLANLKILKQLFKGSGFVNYISSVYLKELCAQANERFYKLSGQKLSLEVTAENNFEIRDFINGGKVRSIKTLSGGQTFQAALSLALALSDNNRKIHGAGENFFFLDEGFGSLDKTSLGVVYETLKSLRRENRMVGIISHVEEMQQEIDIHLRVVNREESGSVIEKSWE